MTDQSDLPPDLPRLSPERIAALRARVKRRLRLEAEKEAALPPTPVVYDAIFWRGTAWLDSLSYTDCWDDVPPDSADPEG